MSCFHPLDAWSKQGQIFFIPVDGSEKLSLPCGQCIGCRIDRSEQWATRCVHEASQHEDNCFITLTYNAENIPPDGGLRVKDFQNFMKRLRKEVGKVRFYHCGEYGDKGNRPHYHAILFGYNFPDWIYLRDSPSGHPIWTSPSLERIWGKGFVTIGEMTYESAAYVARYCLKKINGKGADQVNEETGLKPYERFNSFTGEIVQVRPEYTTMSRRPGIGHSWISDYRDDVYPKDFTTIRGRKVKPPKYYDEQLRQIDPDMYDDMKQGRIMRAYEANDNHEQRLRSKEKVKKARYSQYERQI
jgi:hypothetical protein